MTQTSAFECIEVGGTSAPWLTLVHGASQNRSVFSAQIPVFRDRYRLLLVDLAGHGASSHLMGPFGAWEYAAAVWEALVAARVDRTHFWGTHTGTSVGLLLATRHPDRFLSLVLEGAVIPGQIIPSVVDCYERAKVTARDKGIEAARTEWFERSPWFDVMRRSPELCRADAHRVMLSEFGGAPWLDIRSPQPVHLDRATLSALRTHTLLVNGEHEVPDFLPGADELGSLLVNVRRTTIADAGGFPLWEYPQRVNDEVLSFFKGLTRD